MARVHARIPRTCVVARVKVVIYANGAWAMPGSFLVVNMPLQNTEHAKKDGNGAFVLKTQTTIGGKTIQVSAATLKLAIVNTGHTPTP